MAAHKRTHARKKRTTRLLQIPEAKGKIVEGVEADGTAIIILFADNTALSFNFAMRLSVLPAFANRKGGNWRVLKRWPPQHS
jgi:hypothetical protein